MRIPVLDTYPRVPLHLGEKEANPKFGSFIESGMLVLTTGCTRWEFIIWLKTSVMRAYTLMIEFIGRRAGRKGAFER